MELFPEQALILCLTLAAGCTMNAMVFCRHHFLWQRTWFALADLFTFTTIGLAIIVIFT